MHHYNILFSIKVLAYVGMEMEFSLLQQASNTSRLLLKNGACAVFSWYIRNMVVQFDMKSVVALLLSKQEIWDSICWGQEEGKYTARDATLAT